MNTASLVIELTGHIIDSLTLAKVIDKIQATGLDYQVNDLRVGQGKSDISRAQLSVWGGTSEELELLLEELRVYGVVVLGDEPTQWLSVTQSGIAPTGSYLRRQPPLQVFSAAQGWQDVEIGPDEFVILQDGPKARWVSSTQLQVGQQVAAVGSGIRVAVGPRFPTLS